MLDRRYVPLYSQADKISQTECLCKTLIFLVSEYAFVDEMNTIYDKVSKWVEHLDHMTATIVCQTVMEDIILAKIKDQE